MTNYRHKGICDTNDLYTFWFTRKFCFQGYSDLTLYEGEYIASKTGTIVVTMNYRIGALGFLAYSDGVDTLHGSYGLKVGS